MDKVEKFKELLDIYSDIWGELIKEEMIKKLGGVYENETSFKKFEQLQEKLIKMYSDEVNKNEKI